MIDVLSSNSVNILKNTTNLITLLNVILANLKINIHVFILHIIMLQCLNSIKYSFLLFYYYLFQQNSIELKTRHLVVISHNMTIFKTEGGSGGWKIKELSDISQKWKRFQSKFSHFGERFQMQTFFKYMHGLIVHSKDIVWLYYCRVNVDLFWIHGQSSFTATLTN